MTIFRFSAVLLLVLAGCRGADDKGDARRLALAFCRAVKANETQAAEALTTPALKSAIAKAKAADAAFAKANPGDKPPLGDGIRWTAAPDAVDSCTPVVETPGRVTMTYVPAGDAAGGWNDRLLLEREPGGRLVIGDIVFGLDEKDRLSIWLAQVGAGK